MIARILHKLTFEYASVNYRGFAMYNTQSLSLEHLINEKCNPMVFKKTIKIHYETFDLLIQYLSEEPSHEGVEHSALYHWVESRRKDSMTLRTAVACGVLTPFGSGSLDEKAATLSMHKSTFDGAAIRVIAELVERSNEVIYFPLKKEQAFLESRNVRWAVCHRRYSMQMRCEGEKKRLLLPKGVCLHQCANKVTGTRIWYT